MAGIGVRNATQPRRVLTIGAVVLALALPVLTSYGIGPFEPRSDRAPAGSPTNARAGSEDLDRIGSVSGDSRTTTDPSPSTVFTGDGSRDDADISGWRHRSESTSGEEDLTAAYVAGHSRGGDTLVHFGVD
ncbi:MAG: hypothetical protein ACRDOJ_02115, partial [Nocardioidaceae bacterium]